MIRGSDEKNAGPDGAAAQGDGGDERLCMAAAHMAPCRNAELSMLAPPVAGGWAGARLHAADELGAAADKSMAIRTEGITHILLD